MKFIFIHRIPAVVDKINLPTPYITAPMFGGPDHDILFASSAILPVNFFTGEIGEPLEQSPAGDLFMIRGLSARGVPSYRPKL